MKNGRSRRELLIDYWDSGAVAVGIYPLECHVGSVGQLELIWVVLNVNGGGVMILLIVRIDGEPEVQDAR